MRKLAWFAGAFSAAVFLAVYLLPEGFCSQRDWPALWRPCWGCCSGVTAAGG